ncbi:MAG: endolytic transglycosylase MltG [Vicinamibacterales bacterium]
MRRKLLLGLALLALVVASGAMLTRSEFSQRVETPYRGYQTPDVFVDVESGDSTRVIAGRLAAAGVVRDDLSFRLAVWRSGRDRALQAGEYYFDQPLSAMQVVEKIAQGRVFLRSITFPEGLTIVEMAHIFEDRSLGSREAFLEAAQRVELIAELDDEATSLEGYLFPETYSLPRDATAADLVDAMVSQFHTAFGADLRQVAAQRGTSLRDVVTLASLIQKETGNTSEHALVSAVYNNRLRIGMALQCDPTVIYALELDGVYDGNLTRENLQYDSPYNTYRYPGLPPGPIAAPGLAVLAAALHPADVSYLYLVSRNDGSHEFANTLREHNRNVQKFQVQYFRDQRARQSRP